jgi:hypothetical protein
VHELADGGEDGADRLIMLGERFIDPHFDLIEAPGANFLFELKSAQVARGELRR